MVEQECPPVVGPSCADDCRLTLIISSETKSDTTYVLQLDIEEFTDQPDRGARKVYR